MEKLMVDSKDMIMHKELYLRYLKFRATYVLTRLLFGLCLELPVI